eukprot:gb/GECG01008878.1/.p1 GENE.gb/GECG01008878.1/~~gb/GECG01008878.1/.p1  ORF type:complete len:465 (+),score=42.58 gb/GECG01008878.1/:1-1395(+)
MSLQFLVAVVLTVCSFLVGAAQGAIEADRVQSLPGWSGALPSKHYSGYFSVADGTKHLHYWFVESENDPDKDPVVAWYNGGPGCSSVLGFLTENGPFAVNLTDNGPILVERSTRWNKFANVLYFESPAGVGFSYAESTRGYTTNDSVTANDNYEALVKFFDAYSQYRSHELFLTGESYAGVYVPTLAYLVLKRSNQLNLKGIMVGNGCTGNDVGTCSPLGPKYVSALLGGKGLFSDKVYETIKSECTDWVHPSSNCQAALKQMHAEVGPVDVYDVYAPCINTGSSSSFENPLLPQSLRDAQRDAAASTKVSVKPQPGPVSCGNNAPQEAYLNQVSVRSALHVASENVTGKWKPCSNLAYTMTQKNEPKYIYPDLIKNYRVLIYNGDSDSCVPYTDNEEWTSNMNIPQKNAWRPWYVNDQVAGYYTQYEQEFGFITVKGSGHMVPQFKPEQAYAMTYRFVFNKQM